MTRSDIVFLDTETLGLDPNAPVWEFAAIRRCYNTAGFRELTYHCFIKHRPHPWVDRMPDQFADDYRQRFQYDRAISKYTAGQLVSEATAGAHIVGAVPSFDTPRLALILKAARLKPSWHYHLVDVENMAVGYLAAKGKLQPPPWKSDMLSQAIGVDPLKYQRHSAMGDVLWVRAQYDRITGETHADL